MARVGRQRRKYIKQGMSRLASGKDLVSDSETRQQKQATNSASQRAVQGFQTQINRTAQAAPRQAAASLAQTSAGLAQQAADAAVKGEAEMKTLRDAVRARREAQLLQRASQLTQENKAAANAAFEKILGGIKEGGATAMKIAQGAAAGGPAGAAAAAAGSVLGGE